MSHKFRLEYLERIRSRYLVSTKVKKTQILNEFCETWNLSRKYAIKLILGKLPPTRARRGPKPKYDDTLIPHILRLWNEMERISPKRLKEALALWLPFYKESDFTPEMKVKILKMSASTLGRFLQRGRKYLKGLSTTKRARFFRYRIALTPEILPEANRPGYVEADTVGHCGDHIGGEYVHSLTFTDRHSGWTDNRALWTKSSLEVKKGTLSIEAELPFTLISFDSDCGTEFLNYRMMRYFENRPNPVKMTRSRPYHKNDNAHVEQKNFTHVRALFGYERIEDESLIPLMNEIYQKYWNPLNNFFLPSMKLKEKERIGSKMKRKFETPKTPCQRLMESQHLSDHQKRKLKEKLKELNPFELKKDLESKLSEFFSLLKLSRSRGKAA
jgi:hypothetical protein